MAKYAQPESHASRFLFLARAADTGQKDINAGRNYVTQATINAINGTRSLYENAINAIPAASAVRYKELRERNEAIARVSTFTRDFWEVLKRRTDRNNDPAEVLTYYGLPLDGIVPRPVTSDEWLLAASNCVKGDAAAVTAGYTAMANPSASEVDTELQAALIEASEVSDADRAQDEALAAADAFVTDVDLLIADVMAELRFNTRRMDHPSQRRIQRTYGARFRTTPGEPSEGDHSQVIGTGNGTTTEFTATLLYPAIEPGSVTVTDEMEAFADTDNGNGTGTLAGTAGGTGTIQYATGAITVNFNTAPAPAMAITVNYVGQPGNAVPTSGEPS